MALLEQGVVAEDVRLVTGVVDWPAKGGADMQQQPEHYQLQLEEQKVLVPDAPQAPPASEDGTPRKRKASVEPFLVPSGHSYEEVPSLEALGDDPGPAKRRQIAK